MSNDSGLPPSTVNDLPDADYLVNHLFNTRAGVGSAGAPPGRFGRLAMCAAAASALALGVVGTVAYGVWFNHDQRAYAEAMAGARQALGMTASGASLVHGNSTNPVPAPTTEVASPNTARTNVSKPTSALASNPEAGSEQASWIGQVKRPAAATDSSPALAQASPPVSALAAPTSAPGAAVPVRPGRRATIAGDTTKPSSTGTRSGKEARLASQERHPESANSQRKDSLFARMGSFFRRVNYRQHGSGSQQDIYSHP